jgi:hypothetical protein
VQLERLLVIPALKTLISAHFLKEKIKQNTVSLHTHLFETERMILLDKRCEIGRIRSQIDPAIFTRRPTLLMGEFGSLQIFFCT